MGEIIKTIRNNQQLTYKGFLYHFHVKGHTKTFWSCIYRGRCRGRVFSVNVDGELEIETVSGHSHKPEPEKVVLLKIKVHLKELALQSTTDPCELVQQELAKLSPEEIALLPSAKNLKRMVTRFRFSGQLTVADLLVPSDYFKTTSGRLFLQHDNIIRNEIDQNIQRTMVFATEENLRLLFASDIWYADGTFTIQPTLFHHLWTIQGKVKDFSLPLVYVLMHTNGEEEYMQALQLLLQRAAELHMVSQPSTILVDFNRGAADALMAVFPHAQVHISFLHFTQSVHSKLQKSILTELVTADVQDWLRAAVGLAYVRPTEVVKTFELLQQKTDVGTNEKLSAATEVAHYLDTNYIRGQLKPEGAWIPPRYPIEMWNMYERAIKNDVMSDSFAEEWHLRFNRTVRRHKTCLTALVQAIRMEQKMTESVLRKIMAGLEIPTEKKVLQNERFRNSLAKYNDIMSNSRETVLKYCTTMGAFRSLPMDWS